MIHANSRAAHAAVQDNAHIQRIKMKVFLEGHKNFTSNELGEMSPEYDRYQFARRLPEMRDKGTVYNPRSRRCVVSGCTAMEWAVSK